MNRRKPLRIWKFLHWLLVTTLFLSLNNSQAGARSGSAPAPGTAHGSGAGETIFLPLWLRDSLPDPAEPPEIPVEPIADLLPQVDSERLYSLVAQLTGEQEIVTSTETFTLTRRVTYDADAMRKVTQYAYEYFQALGLPVEYHEYAFMSGNKNRRNVIAEQTGIQEPGCIYLLTAHIDSVDAGASNGTAGADDNASGSAAVMLAADLLRQIDFACTLRYTLFTGEEQGMIGSAAYAKTVKSSGEDVRGVVNLDMIAYNSNELPVIELHARDRPGDLALAEVFAGVAATYQLNLLPEIRPFGMRRSDHASFWDQGFDAIMASEDKDDFTPHYHQKTDRLDTLDMVYYTEFTRAAIAAAAHLARPVVNAETLAAPNPAESP